MDNPKTEEPKNEGMYLEAMAQLQKKYDAFNNKRIIIENKNKMLAKELLTCYGMVRIIDSLINPENTDFEIMMTIDVLRGYLSTVVDDCILDFKPEEFDD
tara:strand:- start:346 stop:645 length:300 start_codon:yes stop_codon:yes gene_type:complete